MYSNFFLIGTYKTKSASVAPFTGYFKMAGFIEYFCKYWNVFPLLLITFDEKNKNTFIFLGLQEQSSQSKTDEH